MYVSSKAGIPYLDIYVENLPKGHKIYFVSLDNRVIATRQHFPWFTVYTDADLLSRKTMIEAKEIKNAHPLLYNEQLFMYKPEKNMKVYKVFSPSKSKVPKLESEVKKTINNAKTGLYNIRYEVRVAHDFSKHFHLFGYPSPLVFIPNKQMVELMEKLIDDIGELTVMAADIEVYSTSGGFPKRGDPILTITYTVFRLKDLIFSKDWPEKHIHVLSIPRDVKDIEQMKIESRKLVDKFFKIIEEIRPNFIVTYNGSAFDFPYMEPFITNDNIQLTKRHIIITRSPTDKLIIPHIDLMQVRKYLGSSMGLRSHAAYALDDVALEVAKTLRKFYNIDWLFDSEYIKAERLLNHAKLKDYWERNDPLFHYYILADVYLTALLARVWMFPLIMVSVLSGITPTVVQEMNTGQMAEYVFVELLRRIRFYPELRLREYDYRRTDSPPKQCPEEWRRVFRAGKVYVWEYGLFGGRPGEQIVELDFAQLYPSDMVANAADPTALYIVSGYKNGKPLDPSFRKKLKIVGKDSVPALLMKGGKKKKRGKGKEQSEKERIILLLTVLCGYGPIAWLIYKLYTARKETKKLKKRAKKEKRIELLAPDQAIKIFINSCYGAMSKPRGNLINELLSASVFWRTQKLLYEVIDYIDHEVPKKLGCRVKVLYGDTDSAYVLVQGNAEPEKLAKLVNEYVQSRHGKFYEMELEDTYDAMLIPKQKDRDSPSAKSYICLKQMSPAKIKGEFYKIIVPLAIKERLSEFYVEIIKRKPKSRDEIRRIIRDFLKDQPAYKYFIKKSVSSFINEDDPRKIKRISRTSHYAALYSLTLYQSPGVEIMKTRRDLFSYMGLGGAGNYANGWSEITIQVDPRIVEDTQRAVIVHYLPFPSDPKRFYVYISEDDKYVYVHQVRIASLKIIKEQGETEKDVFEKYILATYRYKHAKIEKNLLLDQVVSMLDKHVVETIYKKLVPALHRGGQL